MVDVSAITAKPASPLQNLAATAIRMEFTAADARQLSSIAPIKVNAELERIGKMIRSAIEGNANLSPSHVIVHGEYGEHVTAGSTFTVSPFGQSVAQGLRSAGYRVMWENDLPYKPRGSSDSSYMLYTQYMKVCW